MSMFTAEEAYDDRSIRMTRAAAMRTIDSHDGEGLAAFDSEVGVRDSYVAWDVLGWLGY
jgi:hypothetical protein